MDLGEKYERSAGNEYVLCLKEDTMVPDHEIDHCCARAVAIAVEKKIPKETIIDTVVQMYDLLVGANGGGKKGEDNDALATDPGRGWKNRERTGNPIEKNG